MSLSKRVLERLRRDRNLPVATVVKKAMRFGAATVAAPWFLREVDVVGGGARTMHGAPIIDNRGHMELGDDVQLISRFAPVRLTTSAGGTLTLGRGCTVNFGAVLSAEHSVRLGDRVSLGPWVQVADHDEPTDARPGAPEDVTIGDDVWLAARVRVLKGARIGAGTVVTAGSVVQGELPPNVIAGGIPARVLRSRHPGEAPPPEAIAEAPTPTPEAKGLVLSDFSAQELARMLARPDALSGVVEAETAPFGQVMQGLLQLAASPGGNDFAVVWTRPDSIAGWSRRVRGEPVTDDEVLAEVDAWAQQLIAAARQLKALFVPTWTRNTWDRGLGLIDQRANGQGLLLMKMNLRLAERLDGSSAYVLDAQRWLDAAGHHATRARPWYLGKIPFSQAVFAEAALDVRAALRGIRGQARKLLVLDLDDTLWGGIVGDQGWQNLKLGGHDAVGEAFVDFQRHIVDLSKRGIALAIVSKNEESVALEAIRSHPEMVLKLEQVSAWRINWRDKAQNVADIAKELNLGLQSVVFIDDNPAERARVKEALPEVFVPDWPEDKTEYVPTFLTLRCFDVPRISQEDLERTRMYAEEHQREAAKASVSSLDEWLQGLGLVVRVEKLRASNLVRTAQLLNKTNQLNLRTRRLTEQELLDWANAPRHEVWAVSVADRFGDAGLTGILGVEARADGTLEVFDYVLSCRVMGRRVEETLLWHASERARELGCARVVAPFIATKKNMPTKSFFERSGFQFDAASSSFSHEGSYPAPVGVKVEVVR